MKPTSAVCCTAAESINISLFYLPVKQTGDQTEPPKHRVSLDRGNESGWKLSHRQPTSALMELTKAPEPISERRLRVGFQGSGRPENSLWEEFRASLTHFLLAGG